MDEIFRLTFNTTEGKLHSMDVKFPERTATETEISLAMDNIIAAGVIYGSFGYYTSKVSAKLIETQIDELNIA